ncbi:MAG: signal peptide peptidase SppA [Alphaproteobacteria bacterium]|nr:signal peptide peptidase SppA [Alphaproteobacteria bacterium]
MSLEPDRLLDRQRLTRHLTLWRVAAVFALVALLATLSGDGDKIRKGNSVARLTVEGVIVEDLEREAALAGLADDPGTVALIIHINSPGGSVVGGESLFHAIRSAAERLPVAVVMGEVAASAGYMVALAGDRIFARQGSITGSIGVIWQTADITGLLTKLGITTEAIKSGPLKAVPSPLEPVTPEVREAAQTLVLDIYDLFVDMVSDRRHLSRAKVERLADGRVFTGRQALKVHLVDEIGGEDEARKWLADMHDVDSSLPVHELEIEDKDKLWRSLVSIMAEKTFFHERVTLDGLISLWHPEGAEGIQ